MFERFVLDDGTHRHGSKDAATTAPAAATPQVPMGSMTMPTADEVTTAWGARPDYVKALPADGQAAYAFALARPDVLQWLPCYCGCAGIPHRSNLDCYFQRREVRGTFTFEEHASFCDICVKIREVGIPNAPGRQDHGPDPGCG